MRLSEIPLPLLSQWPRLYFSFQRGILLNRHFPAQRIAVIEGTFTVSQFPGTTTAGKFRPASLVVFVDPAGRILGDPCVQDIAGIPHNVDKPFIHPVWIDDDR